MHRAIAGLFLTAALITGPGTVLAQGTGLPAGSYQQSCREAWRRGPVLHASCSSPNGAWVDSALDLNACPGADVWNVDGNLRCSTAPGANRPGLPAGTYQQSCHDAVLRGTVLYASCSSPGGTPIDSALNVALCRGAEVWNIDGNLRCSNAPYTAAYNLANASAPLPPGTYQQSCRNVVLRGPLMTGSCTSPNGVYLDSTLDVRACRGADVWNVNGLLQCGTNPVPTPLPFAALPTLPAGSYLQTCTSAVLQGRMLSAMCSNQSGARIPASLDASRCRDDADIANVDGRLQCAASPALRRTQ